MIKADKEKKIKFCCLQSRAAEPYLRMCGVDRKDVARRFLFVEGHGLYQQGSTGWLSHFINFKTYLRMVEFHSNP